MRFAEYIEKKRHGSPDFPIEYYFIDHNHPQYIMPAHWHNEFEIIRVLSGKFNLFLNNIGYSLSEGDIIFVECGCLHRGIPEDCVYECVVFDLDMLLRNANDITEKYLLPIINSSVGVNCMLNRDNGIFYTSVSALFYVLKKQNKGYELEVLSLLFKIFSEVYSQNYVIPTPKTTHSRQAKRIMSLIDWCENNYKEQITLHTLSEVSGLDKKYLCRIFKEYTSKSPINYINELRIENACYEMTQRNKNITEAAFDSGFNDLSYFCKTFKIYKGVTPKEYKKQTFDKKN